MGCGATKNANIIVEPKGTHYIPQKQHDPPPNTGSETHSVTSSPASNSPRIANVPPTNREDGQPITKQLSEEEKSQMSILKWAPDTEKREIKKLNLSDDAANTNSAAFAAKMLRAR